MSKKSSQQKATPKPPSLVIGAYGAGNFGDDLLFLAAANIEARLGHEPICCGYYPSRTKQKFKFVDINDAVACIKELPRTGRVVLGGGGLLWSEESTARFSSLLAIAKMRGLRTAIHGIGLQGPGSVLASSIQLLHDSADEFSVRDNHSLDILQSAVGPNHNAIMLGDIVAREESSFLFERTRKRKANKAPIKIGFNIAWARFSQDPGFRHHVCLSLTNVAQRLKGQAELHYIPQVIHRISMDEQCIIFGEWLRVASDGLISTCTAPETAEELVALIAKQDIILAGRLHTAICASMSGIPFAILNLDHNDPTDKYHSFADAHARRKINFAQHNWEVTDDIVNVTSELIAELTTSKIS